MTSRASNRSSPAGAERRIDGLVRDDRDRDVGHRQARGLADERRVPRVLGVHGDGRVAQQRLGPRGRHREIRPRAALYRIADVVQVAGLVLELGLLVGQRGAAVGAPVDHPVATVDQTLVPQTHEHFPHRSRVRRVEREAGAAPVARAADHLELLQDGVPRLAHERPGPLDELLATEVDAGLALLREQPFDHVLRGDAGVIGARQPLCGTPAHPLEADQHVLDDVVEPVTHVQDGRDVGRRDHDDIRLMRRVGAGREHPAVEPPLVQPALDVVRVVLGRQREPGLGHSLL